MSFDGGNTFQDILAVGGSFSIGGYNRTISTDRGSPIAGRQAWSGNSGGFICTVVHLPFLPPGGRFRWRMASDNSGSGEGWRVDTVTIGCANLFRVSHRLLHLDRRRLKARPTIAAGSG